MALQQSARIRTSEFCKAIRTAPKIVLILFLMALVWFGIEAWRIRSWNANFERIEVGMLRDEVIQLVGPPKRKLPGPRPRFENQTPILDANIVEDFRYTRSTFFLPIGWDIGFDATGHVVRIHHYD